MLLWFDACLRIIVVHCFRKKWTVLDKRVPIANVPHLHVQDLCRHMSMKEIEGTQYYLKPHYLSVASVHLHFAVFIFSPPWHILWLVIILLFVFGGLLFLGLTAL